MCIFKQIMENHINILHKQIIHANIAEIKEGERYFTMLLTNLNQKKKKNTKQFMLHSTKTTSFVNYKCACPVNMFAFICK
jgi:predicted SprT family Zn-dependent metalloprotease